MCWRLGYVWPAVLCEAWVAQGFYFLCSLRRDRATMCLRRALHFAERDHFVYATAKCHEVLGKVLPDPAEALGHLLSAAQYFEQAGAVYEKNMVGEMAKKAEDALRSTLMF